MLPTLELLVIVVNVTWTSSASISNVKAMLFREEKFLELPCLMKLPVIDIHTAPSNQTACSTTCSCA